MKHQIPAHLPDNFEVKEFFSLFFLMANKVGLSGMSQTRTDLQRPRTQNNKNEIRTSSRGETMYLNCVPGANKSTNEINRLGDLCVCCVIFYKKL